MPTKGTKVIAARVPEPLAEDIEAHAANRNMTVNEMLNLDLAAQYKRGQRVQKSAKLAQGSDELPVLPDEVA